VLLAASLLAYNGLAAEPAPKLTPGSTSTITFPEMPPTFYDRYTQKDVKAQMTVFLPRNYDPGRKYPLLVFLNGGDGGTGSNPGVARALSEEKDFVCVSVPLFKASDPKAPRGYIMQDPDAKYMWPFFRTMLARLEALVFRISTRRTRFSAAFPTALTPPRGSSTNPTARSPAGSRHSYVWRAVAG
jgi:hypothetical protein